VSWVPVIRSYSPRAGRHVVPVQTSAVIATQGSPARSGPGISNHFVAAGLPPRGKVYRNPMK